MITVIVSEYCSPRVATADVASSTGKAGAGLSSFCENIQKIQPLLNSFQMIQWPVGGIPGVVMGLSVRTNVIVDFCNLWNQLKGNSILEGSFMLAEKANEKFELKMNKQIAFARRTTSFAQQTFDLDENMRKRQGAAKGTQWLKIAQNSAEYTADAQKAFDYKPKGLNTGSKQALEKQANLAARRAMLHDVMNCPVESEAKKTTNFTPEVLKQANIDIEKNTALTEALEDEAETYYNRLDSLISLMMNNQSSASLSISDRAGSAAKRMANNAGKFVTSWGNSGNFDGGIQDAKNDLIAMDNQGVVLEMGQGVRTSKVFVAKDNSNQQSSPAQELSETTKDPSKAEGSQKEVKLAYQIFTAKENEEYKKTFLEKWDPLWRSTAARSWDEDDDLQKLDNKTSGWIKGLSNLMMPCDQKSLKSALLQRELNAKAANSSSSGAMDDITAGINLQAANESVDRALDAETQKCISQVQAPKKEDTLELLKFYADLYMLTKLRSKQVKGLALTDRSKYLGRIIKPKMDNSIIPSSTAQKTDSGTLILDEDQTTTVCQTKLSQAQQERLNAEIGLVQTQIQEAQLDMLRKQEERFWLEKGAEKDRLEKQKIAVTAEAEKNKQAAKASESLSSNSVASVPSASGTPATAKETKDSKAAVAEASKPRKKKAARARKKDAPAKGLFDIT